MRHLKIYRAVRLIVQHGSIRKAAEVLSVSPSALNRSVQSFEEEMGVQVFDRVPSGVRLSTAGELLLTMIDRHLVEFDEMQGQLGTLRDGMSGTLRVSIGSDLNAGLVPAALAEFARDYPGVSIEMTTDDTAEALHQRAVDLAVLTNPVTDDGVEVLHSQAVRLRAWRQRPDGSDTRPSGLWDVVEVRLLLPPTGTGTRAAVAHMLRRHRLDVGVSTILSAAQIMPHLSQGASICIAPETLFGPGDDTLEPVPLPPAQVQVTVLRSTNVPLKRSEQAFVAILQRQLDQMVPAAQPAPLQPTPLQPGPLHSGADTARQRDVSPAGGSS